MEIRPIRTDQDLEEALRRIEALWGAPEGTPDGDELDILATLVDHYETDRWPMQVERPLGALRFSMDQNGRTQSDLAELLGSRSRASEILNGRRELTLDQIRLIASRWRIPAALLVGRLEDAA